MSLRDAALANDLPRFEQAAAAHLGSWIDALVGSNAAIAPPSRDYEGYLRRTGPQGAWQLAQWCRARLSEGHFAPNDVTTAWQAIQRVGDARAETAWLWAEVAAAVPNSYRWVAQALAQPAHERMVPALRTVLSRGQPPSRVMLADILRKAGGVDEELAVGWLADRVLRPTAVEWLSVDAASHEDALREALPSATAGTREAIVRLLRAVDPKLALDGSVHAGDDGELQTQLRANPTDVAVAEVWADMLSAKGDPRGEYLALDLAIGDAPPERALEMSARQAELWTEHRKYMFGKPCGFPFREKFKGRAIVAFTSDWDHKIRAARAESLIERVQEFVRHVTTARGPLRVFGGRRYQAETANAWVIDAPTPATTEMARLLDGKPMANQYGTFLVCREDGPHDQAAFVAACAANPDITLEYAFQLVWPGSTVPLPHQEGGHYPDNEPLRSGLLLHLASRAARLDLQFGFERFDDPRFLEIYEAICDTLGRTMTPSRWRTLTPSADGNKLVSRLVRFSGPK